MNGRTRSWPQVLILGLTVLLAGGCNGDSPPSAGEFPDVIAAELEPAGQTWTLSATISSPYDSAARYADAFRALGPDGEALGVRPLTHHHADEQPFTRSLQGLMIPDGVSEIVVQARDLANGWGGDTVTLTVPSQDQDQGR